MYDTNVTSLIIRLVIYLSQQILWKWQKNENFYKSQFQKLKILYFPIFLIWFQLAFTRLINRHFNQYDSFLVRNSYQPAQIIPAPQPPALDASPKNLENCGWSTMDYLGLAFILLCCFAVIGGIFACFCCCAKGGRSSNIWAGGSEFCNLH